MSNQEEIQKIVDAIPYEELEKTTKEIREKIDELENDKHKEVYPHVLALVSSEGYEFNEALLEADRVVLELTDEEIDVILSDSLENDDIDNNMDLSGMTDAEKAAIDKKVKNYAEKAKK